MKITTSKMKYSELYTINISKMSFTPLNKWYKSTIKYKNFALELTLDLYISKKVYESGLFEIKDPEYQIKVSQKGKKKGICLHFVFPFCEKKVDFVIERKDSFKLKFKAKEVPSDYNTVVKNIKQRDKEKQSKLNIPPIKVYYGGGVSPK